jgi:formylglycine-generating enzyme required for sulfatase activity
VCPAGAFGGPVRVGSLAYGDATRIESGAGYFGNMDLAGNVWERCVTVGNASGRSFEGRYHGNGALDSSGNPNVTTWPNTTASGAGFRGSSWTSADSFARLSDRNVAGGTNATRDYAFGGRGVRTAP